MHHNVLNWLILVIYKKSLIFNQCIYLTKYVTYKKLFFSTLGLETPFSVLKGVISPHFDTISIAAYESMSYWRSCCWINIPFLFTVE